MMETLPALDVFPVSPLVRRIAIDCDVVSICPFNGHTDNSSLHAEITPEVFGVELFGFRRYLAEVTRDPISHEEIAATVARDLARMTGGRVVVTETFAPDEGLQLTVVAEAP